ncbi:MAG TPA: A24 family peptidase [Gammaproteobacteria bacterium]|jgi:leader peptidase (prepilin peptidase)/N-methyltransferase|nr:A24 family peptidase [Gammaproteobacteria bacterium]
MAITLLLENNPLAFTFLCILLGLLVGSFLNVVIHRLPIMLEREWRAEYASEQPPKERFDLVMPRSRCPHCGHGITAFENVPIISYLMLRGRCSACHAPISPRYVAVETLTGLLSGAVAWHFGFGAEAFGGLFLTWGLIALAGIDVETQLLPDRITLPILWLGLLFNTQGAFTDLRSAVIGAAAGYLSLWLIYQLFKLATGKEGMGYGDFKLYALIGAWLGWQQLLVVILLASGVGAVVGLVLLGLKRIAHVDVPVPFGPFLAAAGWIALMWGHPLVTAYLSVSATH